MRAAVIIIAAVLAMFVVPVHPALAQIGVDYCQLPLLVLEFPAENNTDDLLQAFNFLQARNLRTLMLARPDTDLDTLRLAIATGNQIALALDPSGDVAAQIEAWETTMIAVTGHPGLKLAQVPDDADQQAARDALQPFGYSLTGDILLECETPPELVTVTLDGDAVSAMYNAVAAGAVTHPAVNWQYAVPATVETPTAEAFKAAHVVVIDPGHTNMDRGASVRRANGEYVTEHWTNLQRGRAMQAALERAGWHTVLAHDDGWLFQDAFHGIDLDRDGIINNHDSLMFRAQYAYYVSQRTGRRAIIAMLHADSGTPEAVGYSLFYPDPYETADDNASYRLALYTADHLDVTWQAMGHANTLRGIHPGSAYGQERGPGAIFDIIDWRYRELPAVRHEPEPQPFIGVLIEAGMASNPLEAEILAEKKGSAGMGISHADALEEWMQAELTLMSRQQGGLHSDPAALTAEQIEAVVAGEVNHGDTGDPPRMTFTFDLGTVATNWPTLRATLKQYGISTTFFVTGDFVRDNPVVIRQMLADGHDFQNHSDTHPNFTEMGAAAIQANLQACQAALDQVIGAHLPMRLWRAPFGARNYDVNRAAAEIGMLGVWWSQTGDTTGWQEGVTPDDVYSYVTWNFQPGQIYVAHLNSYADVEAFPRIVEDALAAGYTLGDLWSVMTPEQTALVRGE
jgi:peptidoglycan/xylan/chitin deacetylase (PgdA/CDA1 family)/N-acetylmuramoyl-L-alanine amidase